MNKLKSSPELHLVVHHLELCFIVFHHGGTVPNGELASSVGGQSTCLANTTIPNNDELEMTKNNVDEVGEVMSQQQEHGRANEPAYLC